VPNKCHKESFGDKDRTMRVAFFRALAALAAEELSIMTPVIAEGETRQSSSSVALLISGEVPRILSCIISSW